MLGVFFVGLWWKRTHRSFWS